MNHLLIGAIDVKGELLIGALLDLDLLVGVLGFCAKEVFIGVDIDISSFNKGVLVASKRLALVLLCIKDLHLTLIRGFLHVFGHGETTHVGVL